ncbi:MAG: peptidylprolyl isomerase [Cytophagaceae bacterium]|nr:peptidylprolyl isomerase [Cytophagaceae bacterium]
MKKIFSTAAFFALTLTAFAQQPGDSLASANQPTTPNTSARDTSTLGTVAPGTGESTPGIMIDKIIAKVDNYYVLKSDLDRMFQEYKGSSQPNTPNECQCLESLIMNKFLVAKAEIDSVLLPDKTLENELTGRMDQMIGQYGSEKGIVEQFGKSLEQLKGELRSVVREQLLARQMQQKITEGVKITPSEVRQFFNAIPKDSIPYLPTEVEVGQIVRVAKVTREEKSRLRQRLFDIKKRVETGEDFATLAKESSEDVGSAQNGGNLGFAKRGTMLPEFEAASMKLKAGQMSDIVETEYGFHLIQLVEMRGQEYNARHILLRPEYARLDLSDPKRFLDSIRTRILSDSLKFEKAARDHSEDKITAETGGLIRDRESSSSKLALDTSMEPVLYLTLDTMKLGAISHPIEFRTDDGKSAMRILYYKTKLPPHYASLKDDYQKLAAYALNQKRNTSVEKWFAKSKAEVFIQVDPEYRDCSTLQSLIPSGQ